MSVEATSLMEWSSGARHPFLPDMDWRQTWIGDNLIFTPTVYAGVQATAPYSRTTENIFEVDEHDFEVDENDLEVDVYDGSRAPNIFS